MIRERKHTNIPDWIEVEIIIIKVDSKQQKKNVMQMD